MYIQNLSEDYIFDSSGLSQNASNGLVLKVTAPPVDFINKLVDSIPFK